MKKVPNKLRVVFNIYGINSCTEVEDEQEAYDVICQLKQVEERFSTGLNCIVEMYFPKDNSWEIYYNNYEMKTFDEIVEKYLKKQ